MCDEYKRWTQQLKQHTDNNMGSSVSINSFVRWSRCILTGNFTDKEKSNVAKEVSGSRIALTIIKHIADLVAASVSLNYEIVAADSFRNGLSTWVTSIVLYTTKIRNFTTKIQNLYKKNPEIFFASRGFSIALQVLRTFIYPNVHILSDVLPDPLPPRI
jgi:hypothetical protein